MSDTVYALHRSAPPTTHAFESLPERTDALVIGGGFTGLSAALHLARNGRAVCVVEARRVGDGASGRNGGQLHPGQRRDQAWLARTVGQETADALWDLGLAAVAATHRRLAEMGAEATFRPGLIEAAHTAAEFDEAKAYAAFLARRHGVVQTVLDRPTLAQAIGTTRYVGGVRDPSGGHLNPYAFALGLARLAAQAGASLHEGVMAVGLDTQPGGPQSVTVRHGGSQRAIKAPTVILAGNGYLRRLVPKVDRKILPLVNHIAATVPLDTPLIKGGEAVSDTRKVVRYFRQDAEGRLVFGGGESFGRQPRDVAAFVRPYLAEVYPALKGVAIERAWSGTLAITPTRVPFIRRLAPGVYVAAGYSGQGVGLAHFAGEVIAKAAMGEDDALAIFARLPVPDFPGGRLLQRPIAGLAMLWFSLRDRLAFA
ncbi:MAG: FAD-binding oxidoreductase [Devosia sp.]